MDTPEQDVIDLLESATGVDFGSIGALNTIGEGIFSLERLFNLQAGLSAKDDTLPKRFLKEPMPEGPFNATAAVRLARQPASLWPNSPEGIPCIASGIAPSSTATK
jgi:aldehyde:ferredoxin oxidoreductase